MDQIEYSVEPHLESEEFVDVLRRSTLAARRPVDDLPTISRMLANADLIVTARNARALLVGVSRAITDLTAGLNTSLILLAAPQAETYYPHIGMQRQNSCWRIECHHVGS
jgi:hypothetical protein